MRQEPSIASAALATAFALLLAAHGCAPRAPERATARDRDSIARPQAAAADSGSAQAAAEVIRRYYAAIDACDFRGAYAQWARDGAASGKSFEAFASGFANTAHAAVEIGVPGAIEGAAGSRYIEIPVVVRAITRDAAVQRFTGSYVLRRSEVDGATAAQRHWHFDSATLREESSARP